MSAAPKFTRGGGWKRNYTASTDQNRCTRDITLRDGSSARCMRGTVQGSGLCMQHLKIARAAKAVQS